jgi:hypothetical protein
MSWSEATEDGYKRELRPSELLSTIDSSEIQYSNTADYFTATSSPFLSINSP